MEEQMSENGNAKQKDFESQQQSIKKNGGQNVRQW